jgi:hypothetical protein
MPAANIGLNNTPSLVCSIFPDCRSWLSSSRTVDFGEFFQKLCRILAKDSSLQLESIHLQDFGYSFARGGQPILGRERSSVPGARCLFLISSLLLPGDHA